MKKAKLIIICAILFLPFNIACTNQSKAENEILHREITTLNRKLDDVNIELNDLQLEFDEYKKKMSPYENLSEEELELMELEANKKLGEIKAQEEVKKETERLEKEKLAKEEKAKKEAEEKAGYETGITYNQLARTPDDYIGKKVKFSGKVVQVIESDSIINLRFAVDGNYDNIIYLYYKSSIVSSRILEGDNITIYGTSKGLMSYTSTMGGNITIPEVLVSKIEQ